MTKQDDVAASASDAVLDADTLTATQTPATSDRLDEIKAWVGDRLGREVIAMDRVDVEWLVSEVDRLSGELAFVTGQRNIARRAVSSLVQFRQDVYEAAGKHPELSPGRNDLDVVEAIAAGRTS